MKKLIYKTTIFLLPILLLLSGVELLYQIVPNNYALKNENIQKRYDDIEVLIFGNSHAFYGLNPKYFDKPTFNLSNISQTLYFDYLLFEKHIDKFKNLKYVILNVEFTSLTQLDNMDEDIWRKYYYKRYMDLQVPIVSSLDPQGYFLSSTKNFNSNIRLLERYFSEGTIVDCDKNGFGTNYAKEKRKLNINEIAPITIKRHEDHLLDFSKNVYRIQSMIDECREKEIKVIIVTMPTSKEYSMGVNQLKLQKIINACLSIEKKNKNVRYLNLLKDIRFTNYDFYDPDHLHTEGARKCSIIIDRYINQY